MSNPITYVGPTINFEVELLFDEAKKFLKSFNKYHEVFDEMEEEETIEIDQSTTINKKWLSVTLDEGTEVQYLEKHEKHIGNSGKAPSLVFYRVINCNGCDLNELQNHIISIKQLHKEALKLAENSKTIKVKEPYISAYISY